MTGEISRILLEFYVTSRQKTPAHLRNRTHGPLQRKFVRSPSGGAGEKERKGRAGVGLDAAVRTRVPRSELPSRIVPFGERVTA